MEHRAQQTVERTRRRCSTCQRVFTKGFNVCSTSTHDFGIEDHSNRKSESQPHQTINFIPTIVHFFLYRFSWEVRKTKISPEAPRIAPNQTLTPHSYQHMLGLLVYYSLKNLFLMPSPGLGTYLERRGSKFRFSGWS